MKFFCITSFQREVQLELIGCWSNAMVSIRYRRDSVWFRRFKSGDFDVRDKERPGQKRKFKDEELEKLLDEDPYRTQEELATALNVSQQAVSRRLKALGMVQKDEKIWTIIFVGQFVIVFCIKIKQ